MMYHKTADAKKSLLLTVFFLIMCIAKNSYASQADVMKIITCNVPSMALCGAKLIMPQAASTFLGSGQIADFIMHGPGFVSQALMIGWNGLATWAILKNKKTFMKKPLNNQNSSERKNFNVLLFRQRFSEVALYCLVQSGLLWYQKKFARKSIAYVGLYALINIIPSTVFIWNKDYKSVN
jgi:hypothetical protein